jgi:urease accessory protein
MRPAKARATTKVIIITMTTGTTIITIMATVTAMRPAGRTVMADVSDRALFKLMTWLSPSFPVGAFAYSHGLEFAIENGVVKDAATLKTWIEGVIAFGAGRVDAALFRAAYEAETSRDDDRLARVVERGEVLRGSSELALESSQQGRAFLQMVSEICPTARLEVWQGTLAVTGRAPAYCIAVAVAAAISAVPLRAALNAYLTAFSANLVSAAVRLVPLGQTDGQRVIAGLEGAVLEAVEEALVRDPEDFGAAALSVDWMSMQHETQYTRLFRS